VFTVVVMKKAKPNFLGDGKAEEEIIGLWGGSSQGPKWVVL